MGFDIYNRFMKIMEFIGTSIPKVGIQLGVWRFNLHTLAYFHILGSMKCDSRGSFLAHTFVNLCFSHEPKAKVMTNFHCENYWVPK
jgi:hypothetical protein